MKSKQKNWFYQHFLDGKKSISDALQRKIEVRELVEELIASMLNGSLDDVCVSRLYENIECEFEHVLHAKF